MNWFRHLKTRTKLSVAFGAVILLLVAVIGMTRHYLNAVHREDQAVTHMATIIGNFNAKRAALLSALDTQDDSKTEVYLSEIDARSKHDVALLEQLSAQFRNDSTFSANLAQMKTARAEMVRMRDHEILPLIKEKKKAEAVAQVLGPYVALEEKYRKVSGELSSIISERAEQFLRSAQWLSILLGTVAVLAAVIAVIGLSRAIATPLQKITAAADKIAAGDIHVELEQQERRDEIGLLDQAFQRMCESLRSFTHRAQRISQGDLTTDIQPRSERDVLGNAFATMTRDLRALMQELQDAINVLAATATQIKSTSSQLSSSAVETASAVTETTATVEQVKQTSHLATQKARQVADEAQRAVEAAKTGKTAVDGTIQGMHSIRSQMDIVAESILNLSSQGQAIGEIIATVDDLAAQSKLLAVNASIEAAKAGDEGKGFAVVAQEVRSLAEQSKQATNQVRGILSDIQKATSNAVLATEQGGKTVNAGVAQSAASGESIRTLTETISQAAQASMQIAASSQQQFAGMDQVALAMGNIKSASAQTVAGTQQAETAAQQLHELGCKLKQLIERFHV